MKDGEIKKGKVSVRVGYTKGNIYEDYKVWSRENLEGVDIAVVDGLGNAIELNARKGDIGYRIEVNGKTIATSSEQRREGIAGEYEREFQEYLNELVPIRGISCFAFAELLKEGDPDTYEGEFEVWLKERCQDES